MYNIAISTCPALNYNTLIIEPLERVFLTVAKAEATENAYSYKFYQWHKSFHEPLLNCIQC